MAGTRGRASECHSVVGTSLAGMLPVQEAPHSSQRDPVVTAGTTLDLRMHCMKADLGADTQQLLLITIIEFIWKQISFLEASFPALTNLSRCNLHCQGLQQGTRGSMLCSTLRVACKTRRRSVAPHPCQSSSQKTNPPDSGDSQAKSQPKPTHRRSQRRADTHQGRRAIAVGCHGSVHG